MGQNFSTQHDTGAPSARRSPHVSRPSESVVRSPLRQRYRVSTDRPQSYNGMTSQQVSDASRPVSTFSRQISSQSVSRELDTEYNSRNRPAQEDAFYVGHITHISASPMPRRSRLSRLSTSLVPRQARDDGHGNEGRVTTPRRFARAFLNPSNILSRARRHREATPISHPIPPVTGITPPLSGRSTRPRHSNTSTVPVPLNSTLRTPGSFVGSLGNFLSRLRNSLTDPTGLSNHAPGHSEDAERHDSLYAPLSHFGSEGASQLSPDSSTHGFGVPLEIVPSGVDINVQTTEPVAQRRSSEYTVNTHERRPLLQNPSLAPRSDLRETGRSTNILRRGSSSVTPQNDETSWSRLLTPTAMAIAAHVSSNGDQWANNVSTSRSESIDDVFQPIHEMLQQAVHGHGDFSTEHSHGSTPAPNFFRVLRFGTTSAASSNPTPSSPETQSLAGGTVPLPSSANQIQRNAPERNVTIVVVAVRSATGQSQSSFGQTDSGTPTSTPLIDHVASLVPLAETANSNSSITPPRQITRRSRFPHLHRASHHVSPANFGWLHAGNNGHWGRATTVSTDATDQNAHDQEEGRPSNFGDSPPGPIPPPSTPAEHSLSAVSSQPATPSRRQSVVSSPHHPLSSEDDILVEAVDGDSLTRPQERPLRSTRQRRSSESDFARYRHLGAGAARRNGVVEPDSVIEGDERAGRNWLVYVVGTDLAGDHAWATPTLFSDNPSYEDMLMLSSLLGPAKQSVASAQDVAAAGGTFRLSRSNSGFLANCINDEGKFHITHSERCLVCLEEYQAGEGLRRLSKCAHFFHQTCIDEWLTTGRNSCPLCREDGVKEKPPRGNIAPNRYVERFADRGAVGEDLS